MLTQLLYGDHFKIIEQRKYWSKIKIAHDDSEGWVTNQQFRVIEKTLFKKIEANSSPKFSSDLVGYALNQKENLIPILLGSAVSNATVLSHQFDGEYLNGTGAKTNIVPTAMYYLNAPFMWGGKTPFGIDDAGLSQMVYKVNGYRLPRHAAEQAMVGESLSFIEESEAGDLAFFDDKEGTIRHVGIIMEDNYIVHADGKVRIDRLDHTGIFNNEERRYTHSLRVIKKIV